MRTRTALLLVSLAGAATAGPTADRYAARALLTARVVAELQGFDARMRMAAPLLESLGNESSGPGGDAAAVQHLLREMQRLLGIVGRPPQADPVYIRACRVCERIAPASSRPEWTVRWLGNAVQSDDPKAAAQWVEGFRDLAGAELGEVAARGLGDAARRALQHGWWARPATTKEESDDRVALMEAVLAAWEGGAELTHLTAHFTKAAATIVRLAETDEAAAALGLWDLARLSVVAGHEVPGLGRVTVSLGQRTYDPPSYTWPRRPRKREKIKFDKTVMRAHVHAGAEPLELPEGARYVVPGLPYLLELGLKDGTSVPCFARWAEGAKAELVLQEIPKGYAVIHGAEGGGRIWYARRKAWGTLQLIEAIVEWASEQRDPSDFAVVESFFHMFTRNHDLREPDMKFLRRGFAEHGDAKVTPKTLTAFRDAVARIEGVRLPAAALVESVPDWARKQIGWEGEVVKAAGKQATVPEFVVYDVIEVKR